MLFIIETMETHPTQLREPGRRIGRHPGVT